MSSVDLHTSKFRKHKWRKLHVNQRYMNVAIVAMIASFSITEIAANELCARLSVGRFNGVDWLHQEAYGPSFHIGNVNIRLHVDNICPIEHVGDMVISQLKSSDDAGNRRASSESEKNPYNNNMTVDIPHGGDTSTAKINDCKYGVATDLSDVAGIVMQDFKNELTSIAQKNHNDMKMLLMNVTLQVQKLRYEQDLRRNRHLVKQPIANSEFYNEHDQIESPMLTTGIETINKINEVETNHIVELSTDDNAQVDSTSVPSDCDTADAHVIAMGNPESESGNNASSTNDVDIIAASTITKDDCVDDNAIGENDNSLDFDKTDAVNLLESTVKKIKKRKKRKSRNSPHTEAEDTAAFDVNTIDVGLEMIDTPSVNFDQIDTPSSNYVTIEGENNKEENDGLLPSTNEVLHRSAQRLIICTITSIILCLLYLAMKRFVSILLAVLIGIHAGASKDSAKSSILTSTSTTLPKP